MPLLQKRMPQSSYSALLVELLSAGLSRDSYIEDINAALGHYRRGCVFEANTGKHEDRQGVFLEWNFRLDYVPSVPFASHSKLETFFSVPPAVAGGCSWFLLETPFYLVSESQLVQTRLGHMGRPDIVPNWNLGDRITSRLSLRV